MRLVKIKLIILLAGLFSIFACCNREQPSSNDFFKFEGRIKWDPDNFSPLPESAPFDMTIQLDEDTLNDKKVLDMQLLLHNTSQDTVFLAAGAGETAHFDFVVTMLDSTRIWNRLQSNLRAQALMQITLLPGESHRFKYNWNYTDYDEKPLTEGTYLIYGGIEFFYLTDRSLDELKAIGQEGIGEGVGVGPDTLVIN